MCHSDGNAIDNGIVMTFRLYISCTGRKSCVREPNSSCVPCRSIIQVQHGADLILVGQITINPDVFSIMTIMCTSAGNASFKF